MPKTNHKGQKKTGPALLELVLRLQGDFRRLLQPIRVTPLQAGVLSYIHRHTDVRVGAVADALRVQPPTIVDVVQDLVRKGWVTNRRLVADRRAVCLRLTRKGEGIVRGVTQRIRQAETLLINHDSCVLGMDTRPSHQSSRDRGIFHRV